MNEPKELIDRIASQTRTLLQNHWHSIDSYRDGDDEIKLAFSHTLSYEGSERTVKTTISFSHRIKDQVEESFDLAQEELPIEPEQREKR